MSIDARNNKIRGIYLDNAASTPIDIRVQKEMIGSFKAYANPSSFNDIGREARAKLNESRLAVARFLGSKSEEIVFTSSGSEANSLATLGLAEKNQSKKEIIVSPIEHLSVLEALKVLKRRGYRVVFLKVNTDGLIDLDDLKSKLSSQTLLVSIMYANNEIGTIEPIKAVAKIIKDFRNNSPRAKNLVNNIEEGYPYFHVDACQATEYLDMNVNNLGVDLMTFNGSKIYGPRGIGVLYKRNGINLTPLIYGGSQEQGLRAGTENLPSVVGLAKALSLIDKKEGLRLAKLQRYFFDSIGRVIEDVKINGPIVYCRLPNNINISVPELSSETLLLELDKEKIYASSGSACTSHSVEPSHVLKAIRVSPRHINGALRFSMGRETKKKDIESILMALPRVVKSLRKIYPR